MARHHRPAVHLAGNDGAGPDDSAGADLDEWDGQTARGGEVETAAPIGLPVGGGGVGALFAGGENLFAAADCVCCCRVGAIGVSSVQ